MKYQDELGHPIIIPYDINESQGIQQKNLKGIKQMIIRMRKQQNLQKFIKEYSKLSANDSTSGSKIPKSSTYDNKNAKLTNSALFSDIQGQLNDDVWSENLMQQELDEIEYPQTTSSIQSKVLNNIRRSILAASTFLIIFISILSVTYLIFPGSFYNSIFSHNNYIASHSRQYFEMMESNLMNEPEYSESGGVVFDDYDMIPLPKVTVDIFP